MQLIAVVGFTASNRAANPFAWCAVVLRWWRPRTETTWAGAAFLVSLIVQAMR